MENIDEIVEMFKDVAPEDIRVLIEEAKRSKEEEKKRKRNALLAELRIYLPDLIDFPNLGVEELQKVLNTIKSAEYDIHRVVKIPHLRLKRLLGFFSQDKTKVVIFLITVSLAIIAARLLIVGV